LENLPIPKIEGSNTKYDFSIEGLILHVNELMPDFVHLKTKTDTTMNVHKLATEKSSTKVIMEVDKIRAMFKSMKFFYRRKRTPKMEDHGVADVDLSKGTGISIKIVWKLKTRSDLPFHLQLVKVKCNIDKLAITVKSAKHSILDKLATKLFAGQIKKQIANSIVENIMKALIPMGERLNDLFKRRPIENLTGQVNDGMKVAFFSGETGQPSLLQKATETVNSELHSLSNSNNTNGTRVLMNSGSNPNSEDFKQYTTGYYGTHNGLYTPISYGNNQSNSGHHPSGQTTFIERTFIERRPQKNWNYEWYSPSVGHANQTAQINQTNNV
jgi:hypothetical protein